MEKITLEDLADAIRTINPKRYTAQLDRYIKSAAVLDQTLGSENGGWPEKRRRSHEACYEDIQREASRIQKQSTLTVNRLIHFRFPADDPQKGIPERKRQTRFYFSKIKKQQMEVLSTITDEIDIIQSMIDHSRKVQSVFMTHSKTLLKTAGLMSIIRERIVRRPTTLLRLAGRDRKIQQLNDTFERIQDFENTHAEGIRRDAEENPVSSAMSSYYRLTQGTYSEIERRKTVIEQCIKDLKRGGKLLLKLASKGYSPMMKRNLDMLVYQHEDRTRDFYHHIRENRILLYSDSEH